MDASAISLAREYKNSNIRVTTTVIKDNIKNYNINMANVLLGRNSNVKFLHYMKLYYTILFEYY